MGEAAIEEALAKLDIGYIDMMLLHHPRAGDVDAYLAMEKAVADGKIRSLGLCLTCFGLGYAIGSKDNDKTQK